jgi:hypothetical protein
MLPSSELEKNMRPHHREDRSASPAVARYATVVVLLLAAVLPARSYAQSAPPASEATPADVQGVFAEPKAIGTAIAFGTRLMGADDGGEPKNGLYPEMSNMITGSGWISAGPGYRQWIFSERALVETSAAYSWRAYKMAQARMEFTRLVRGRLAVGSLVRWQDYTQITYFGEGPESVEADRSEYRLRAGNVVGYVNVRPARWLTLGTKLGWLTAPSIGAPTGPFLRGNPDTREVFPDDPVYQVSEQPDYVHGEIAVTADTRDSRGYPSRGGLYRASWSRYSDRGVGAFSFRRYEAEAAHFVPAAGRRLVLALRGWMVASDTGPGQTIPFYLLPSLGGANTIRSVSDYRFHDRHSLVLNAESRLALFTHLDLAAFVDAGNVAARVGDLNVDTRAYGLGVRLHSRRATIVRIDMAHGTDGWRFLLRTNDSLRLARVTRRTAAAPFVP